MEPMGEPAPAVARQRRSGRRRRTLYAIAALVVAFSAVTARVFVWPPLPALPARADAIIELGGQGGRDAAAIALARDHRAAYLVQSTTESEAGTHTCLPAPPDVTVLCFRPVPDTTRGEARAIAALAAELHWTSVILVTTPDQAVRARLRVSRCFSGSVYVSTTPLPAFDWFKQIPYQWAATAKALLLETSC
jgi:uncharacterized SAM-binding protein YcdF (DUF218 family)